MSKNVKRIYIDASPILSYKLSGIGHLTLMMIRGLITKNAANYIYDIRLLVPVKKIAFVSYWNLSEGVTVTKVPLLARIWNTLPRLPFTPPIDIFFGKGVYIFPNFKHWPVAKSRSITYIHDISFLLYPEFTEPKNLTMLSANVGRWVNDTNVLVTDSETSKREIVEYFPASSDKVKTIHCGVDGSLFKRQNASNVAAIQSKYGLEKKYFMFLSSLEPRKNIETLLEGFRSMPNECKDQYSLLLVGGMGWNNEGIVAKISQLRSEGWNVIVPEAYVPDEDIPGLLTGAELLIHPALHEGFGIPPLEAMACGTPSIVSDIEVMHEVCGGAAIYVDPHNPDDVALKMQQLVDDGLLRQKIINLGYERIKDFTWERATTSLMAVINDQFGDMPK